MTGNPKEKRVEDGDDEMAREKGQKKRQYYYDDAHGYEVFDPDSEEADQEDNQTLH